MSLSREAKKGAGEGEGEGRVVEGIERQRERQLIRLGDDSPMLGIYSIEREGGVGDGGARGQAVWEAARTASSHRRQGVVEGERRRPQR